MRQIFFLILNSNYPNVSRPTKGRLLNTDFVVKLTVTTRCASLLVRHNAIVELSMADHTFVHYGDSFPE